MRPGRPTIRHQAITITLPIELFERLEDFVRKADGLITKAEIARRALVRYLDAIGDDPANLLRKPKSQ